MILKVKTYKGEVKYSSADIKEILDDFDMYLGADNLPKWIKVKGMQGYPFPTKDKDIKNYLEIMLKNNTDLTLDLSTR